MIFTLLQLLGDASDLKINLNKSTISEIRCSEEQELLATTILRCSLKPFLIVYLGLPLSTGKLHQADNLPIDPYLLWKCDGL